MLVDKAIKHREGGIREIIYGREAQSALVDNTDECLYIGRHIRAELASAPREEGSEPLEHSGRRRTVRLKSGDWPPQITPMSREAQVRDRGLTPREHKLLEEKLTRGM